MIRVRLSFSKNETHRDFDIISEELLIDAVERATKDVPKGRFKTEEIFNVVVNGHIIESSFWSKIRLIEKDHITISPVMGDGDAGSLFKQAVILATIVIAGQYELSPLLIAGIAIGETLLLNALIPPPVPNLGDLVGGSGVDGSQMYAITGQSNQLKRFGTVPKVYGTFRMFPNVAATPYTELAVSTGDYAYLQVDDIYYRAKAVGPDGNNIVISYVEGGTAGTETVTVSGTTITITMAAGLSTAQDILTKLEASSAAMALVDATLTGIGDELETSLTSKNLVNGANAGQVIQYFYCIYDFGLGTMLHSNLQIGDTPLSTNSFQDFDARWVDPNVPQTNPDTFDGTLNNTFKYYHTKRADSPLSITLADGDEDIQFSDQNVNSDPQEIILNFVCPSGLFGFSSQGEIGNRVIHMEIFFAKVGTNDWHAYNDLDYVDSYSAVGGSDLESFNQQFYIPFSDHTLFNKYYESWGWDNTGTFNTPFDNGTNIQVKLNQNKLLVKSDARWTIGSKIFIGKEFIGLIQSLSSLTPAYTEITLDRIIPTTTVLTRESDGAQFTEYNALVAAKLYGSTAFDSPTVLTNIYLHDVNYVTSYSHNTGASDIVGASESPIYANFKFKPKEAAQYQIRVQRITTTSDFTTQKQDALVWSLLTTAYLTAPIVTTKRHLFLELKIRATDQLNGSIQNLSAVVSSILPVYDPDTQTWTREVTNNPAWVVADLLTGEVNKKAIDVSKLDIDSFVEWADYCDAVPTPPPGKTYLDPRFQSNFILDYDTTLQQVIQQVGGAAQASLNIVNGKHGILIDRERTTPVQIFTPRNSKGFSSARIYSQQPDAVNVSYIDPNLNWQSTNVTVYAPGFDADNTETTDELTAFSVTNYEQAWRFGRYMIAQNKLRQETITLIVDFENLVCSRGDFVQITQDVMRVGGTPCRIKAVSGSTITTDDSLDINELLSYGYTFRSSDDGTIYTSTLTPLTANTFAVDGTVPAVGDLIAIGEVGKIVFDCVVKGIDPNDDMSATLTLIEKADGIFAYESTDVLPDYDPQISQSSNPDFDPPDEVTNLVVSDNGWKCADTKSGYAYFVELTWDMPINSIFEFFQIWVNDGTGYKLIDTTTNKNYTYDVDQSRLDIPHGFKVVAVSASGKKLELIAMATAFATPHEKDTPPSDVTDLNMSITNQILQLSWDFISDCDAYQYVVRFSPDLNAVWESSTALTVVAKTVNTVSVQARTGVYFIKAIDYAGNQSAIAAVGITTIPNLFDLNIIEVLNDAPTFSGTLDRVVPLGDAIILDEAVTGSPDDVQYYSEGIYTSENILDLDDVYTVRLQSLIQADGYKFDELMSDWTELDLVDHLNTATSDDWDVSVEYRATDVFAAMSDWVELAFVDHINFGSGDGFTDWRPIPTTGDATGRIFQFRIKLESLTPNVTPRLFDGSISADMPDRIDSFENNTSSASAATIITYDPVFKGPDPSPNVQISVDNGATGDYWSFDSKTLEGLAIRFYDKNGTQVVRQFDVVAKGFGRRHTTTI